ncbi:Damage-control phosphatase ARMT1 [Frankliniella fusca]|uniref:Sugar phosphate phosphatase n=1 Tax=Frankliniella fusca TaxID=407009 RepID=A0AAE1HA83_9NEOP|nr:Damage-control phosphatase ARMT1 [Frankliniella fusca]
MANDCIDAITPWNEPLSAKYIRSFAYHTVRNRLPVTLTQVIDHLSRNKEDIAQSHGEAAREEIKDVIAHLSKLKNEMQTNKPLEPFHANEADKQVWNDFLENSSIALGRPLLWFADVWLYIECYLYRRIREAFALTKLLNDYDPFRVQKEDAFTGSLNAISVVGSHLFNLCSLEGPLDAQKYLMQFMKLSLWGNRCDLSISGGKDIAQVNDPLEMISQLDNLILVNDLPKVLDVLRQEISPRPVVIDIIFDNAGYELFTDLCLAHLLMKLKLTDIIRFHGKKVPWFISDVMKHDFNWLMNELSKQTGPLQELHKEWSNFLSRGQWVMHDEFFWTSPYSYDCMEKTDQALYNSFKDSKLLIFKGDLNYRKLVGDMNWPHTEDFTTALRGFTPAPLVSLRTIKADVVVGLCPGQAEEVAKADEDWLLTGKYAVISCFTANKRNVCKGV